ncbi:MAG TPA: response regulator, partial [Terriglobia bacterium]|nr:response regulator [Terriglobia bacterium]
MKIVISDGERFLNNLLKKWGYEVLVAEDGPQALRLLQQENPPKVAIFSCEMKNLSGIEVCSRLRQAVKEPYIYLVLLTSTSQKDDLIEGLAAGADDYVIKPFDAYELRARL